MSKLTSDIGSLKESCSKLEDELASVKSAVEDKADMSKVLELQRRIVDLQNRSRRNNVVVWNVPESSKDGMCMTEFIQHLLNNHMKLEEAEAIEIMRAHRTPTTRNRDQLKSRPIHVYLLRYTDRQFILASAAKSLKDNPFKGSKLYISDDVTKEIRDQRKLLKEEHLKTLREREDVEFAYVAWSIPARIIYKLKDQSALKSSRSRRAELFDFCDFFFSERNLESVLGEQDEGVRSRRRETVYVFVFVSVYKYYIFILLGFCSGVQCFQ